MRAIFESATEEHLQKSLRTPEDWDRYMAMRRETDARLMQEQAAYKRDFDQRMSEAKQMILREEHGVHLDKPLPPWAHKQSDADMLEHKAHARVQDDHSRRIKTIRRDLSDQIVDLTAEIRARDAPVSERTLTQSFEQSRSGPTRT
ncbi:hypothetical protein [Tateyamaria sp. SN3-11]|uniref:hypothetical protein n=1 Tax=Tateyamaria sp. SN3-11 TaxID=3092147 RepID=UPI0039EC0D2E